MEITTAIKKENANIPGFDGIRGIYSLLILITHLHFTIFIIPFTLAYTSMHGFFIMSAFLISRSLIYEKNKSLKFSTYFKIFYIKRSLRIFPVYFAYILVIVLIMLLTYGTPYKQLLGITYELKNFGWMLLTFTYNLKDLVCLYTGKNFIASYAFPHLWSLSLEEQFYFIIPFLIWFCSIKTLKKITLIVIFSFIVIRIIGFQWLITHPGFSQFENEKQPYLLAFTIFRATPFQFDTFFYGLFIVLFDIKNKKLLQVLFWASLLLLIVSIAANGYLIANKLNISFIKSIINYKFMIYNGQYIYIDLLVNIFCVSMFYLCFMFSDNYSILSNAFLVFIGKISYGIYVYQYLILVPCLYFFSKFMINTFGLFFGELLTLIIAIGLVIGLSYFSYQAMEIYFIKKKDKYIAKYKK